MSEAEGIARLDATAQAKLVKRKEIKPIELVDTAIGSQTVVWTQAFGISLTRNRAANTLFC